MQAKETSDVRADPVPAEREANPQHLVQHPGRSPGADAACAGGVATKRELERVLAPTGQLPEALPEFESAQSVAKAGVLVALPALLEDPATSKSARTVLATSNPLVC